MHLRRELSASIIVLVLAVGSTPVPAHHAFTAEFDANRPVHLEGPVIKVEWINPHAWIHLRVTKEDGSTEDWMVEGGTPNTLARRGVNRDSLETGTVIIIDGYQAKNGSLKANGRDLFLPDGTKLFVGTSGTGAPSDGADPRETRP
jgi:hypothetical protein